MSDPPKDDGAAGPEPASDSKNVEAGTNGDGAGLELVADEEERTNAVPSERPQDLSEEDEGERQRKRRHALVYLQKLTKIYPISRGLLRKPKLLHALNGVSFYIRRGETFGLVGESGSGKSTLGRCILRLIEPTVGRVIFDGKNLTALAPAELRAMRQRMQIVFQDPYSSLDPNMTLAEIVGEGIEVFKLAESPKAADQMVVKLLERVGLEAGMKSRYPHELSGGQRQRVAIARALAVKPDFIVLDEPTAALDLSVQAQILNLLQDLQEELGLAQLFISHDLRTVQYVSHRIGVMYLGKLVELGPAEAVTRKRLHPYTRALFGAMPQRPGETTSKRLHVLADGEPPSAIEPPPGCAFFARCPQAEEGRCDDKEPPLNELKPNSHHRVACWHPNLS